MTGAVLLAGLVAVLIVVLVVVVFYGVRLARASRQAADSADRLREFMRKESAAAQLGMGNLSSAANVPGEEVVLSDIQVGLAGVADSPVYLACDQSGAVLVQVGARPLAPLSYVLDPKAQRALGAVVVHAKAKFGRSWSILACDDPQGSLTLRRLS